MGVESFGEGAATVACRQLWNDLGYLLDSASEVSYAETDDGTSPSYKVTCTGTEATLKPCPFFTFYFDAEFVHQYNAGVSCTFLAPSDECEVCSAGKFSDTTDASACVDCPNGSTSSAGATECFWQGNGTRV